MIARIDQRKRQHILAGFAQAGRFDDWEVDGVSPVKSAPHVIIASPALAAANNGNWQTAYRWSRMLADDYRVSLLPQWRGVEDGDADALIALHARRSAASIAAWARHWPKRPLIVVLTGTDLYRDIRSDADAQRSLAQATQLVVLQEHGPLELPAEHRAKCVVIFQSASRLQPGARPSRHLQVVMAGHLRSEKDPLTYLRAVQRLQSRDDLRFEHIGRALEPPSPTRRRRPRSSAHTTAGTASCRTGRRDNASSTRTCS